MAKQAAKLTTKEQGILSGFSGIISTVNGLLGKGISTAEVAESVLQWVSPSSAAEVGNLIKVLQEVQSELAKA